MRTEPRAILAILLGVLTVGSVQAGQQALAAAVSETREEIVKTRDPLQSTVNSISALVDQKKGDLRPAYDNFTAQVSKTQAAAAATKARAQKMQAQADTHFSGWRSELESINNPSLKKKSIKRLESVQKQYTRATEQLKQAADKFGPYLSDLGDMQK